MVDDLSILSLKDRDLKKEGLLVTEGRTLTQRLIDSPLKIAKVICSVSCASEWEERVSGGCEIMVVEDQRIQEIAGYPFHRGVLGIAHRPNVMTIKELLTVHPETKRLVGAIDLTDPENLGSLGRSTWALGWDALILGPRSPDPFSRLALKVSMGAFLFRPLAQACGPGDLEILHQKGFVNGAAVVGQDAQDLKTYTPPPKLFLAFGNEASGLDPSWIRHCDLTLTIPMAMEADSLNVGVAAGIFLHALR